MKRANIVFHTKHDLRGNLEQVTCEWDGPKDGTVEMSMAFADELGIPKDGYQTVNKLVTVGPYQLRCFDFQPWNGTYLFIRVDSIIGNIRVIVYRLTRWLDLIYRRLIITAAVWRLAEYHQAQIPTYQDLYIVKWVKEKWQQKFQEPNQ